MAKESRAVGWMTVEAVAVLLLVPRRPCAAAPGNTTFCGPTSSHRTEAPDPNVEGWGAFPPLWSQANPILLSIHGNHLLLAP